MTQNNDNIKRVDGGVCAAKGFFANGIYAGIKKKKEKKDLGVIYSKSICSAAAVYTKNKVCGANIIVSKEHLKNGQAKAIICNSGNANTCNKDGVEVAKEMCKYTAMHLNIDEQDVVVASTGVIGMSLPIDPIKNNLRTLIDNAQNTAEYSKNAALSILTTDTFTKEVAYSFELDGKTISIGGIAKGSGMIHPNMATMLSFITTDINITPQMLQKALSEDVINTYNMISIDGDSSTNDMCVILANGEANNKLIDSENDDYKLFCHALNRLNTHLSKLIAKDGEGATKLIECEVINANNLDTARKIAKSVIQSSLVKSAIFGCDMNWGRILCAIGYTDIDSIEIDKIIVTIGSSFGSIEVFRNGYGLEFDEDEGLKILKENEIKIMINMNSHKNNGVRAVSWGCDLTYDYVKINSAYRS